jgi:hypothetical protein
LPNALPQFQTNVKISFFPLKMKRSQSRCAAEEKKNLGKFFLPKLTVCEKIAQSVFALLFFQSSTNVPINKAAPLQFVLQYLNENSQSKQSPKRQKVSLSQKD